VIYSFRQLIAQDTGVIILQAMALTPIRRPTSIMEYQPDKELAFRWRPCFGEDLSSFDWMLTNEEGSVGGRSDENFIQGPHLANSVVPAVVRLNLPH